MSDIESTSKISAAEVIEALEASARTITVCVPSDEFYRSSTDWVKEELTVIDATKFLNIIHNLFLGDTKKSKSEQKFEAKIIEILSHTLAIPKEQITPETILGDLGCDSLDEVEIAMEIEDEFGVQFEDHEINCVETVQDLFDIPRLAPYK